MTDHAAQTAYYHPLAEALRDWDAGGTVCVFGAAIPGAIRNQFSLEHVTRISEREYDICNLYNLDGRWDTIVVNAVLEHVPYPWIAVEEIRKHLKPHGVALFITHAVEDMSNEANDYWRFTPEGLRVLCANYAVVIAGHGSADSEENGALPITWAVARVPDTPVALASWQPPAEEHAAEGGPWQVDDFAETGGDQWVEKRVCDYVVSTFAPATALDVGCGAGLFVSYLNHRAVDTWGIEAADLRSIFPLPEKFIQHDLRMPLNLDRQFDLVVCLEVAEHIDAAFEQVLFDTIRRHSKRYLLFSAAILGQEGHGHINLHPESYWLARLRELGYQLLIEPTNICRALCVHPWYAKNISFWELVSDHAEETAYVVLPDHLDLPDSYVRRLENDYAQQREYIDTLQQTHDVLTSSWEEQRRHIDSLMAQSEQQRAAWERQQQHIDALTVQYEGQRAAWERQQQHIDALTAQYEEQRAAWERQQQHITESEHHMAELQAFVQRQQKHVTDLEQRHAELQESWEAQQNYMDDVEQQRAKLAEEWDAQHQYIEDLSQSHEDLSQRHKTLIEEWQKQRDYINQQLYKQ